MEIQIKGTIIPNDDKKIYDFFNIETTTPRDVAALLESAADDESIDVYINSGGGDVFSAVEIYSTLQRYGDRVKTHVVGIAASAASIIMCVGKSDITAASMVMIHNVSSYAVGDHRDLAHGSETLRQVDRAVCGAYTSKTGKQESDILALMDKETWLTAKEAVDLGFCDSLVGRESYINACCTLITEEQRREYKNMIKKAGAQLRLEKLKGEIRQ